jgi:hypothetical protein
MIMIGHSRLARFKARLQWLGRIGPASRCEPICGPDFICIGMLKAGTAWLYDQLRYHPDFWMPPVKELRYLHDPLPSMQNARERLSRVRNRTGLLSRMEISSDLAFLKAASELAGQPRDITKYAALFRFKGSRLSGDITPGYSRLAPHMIAEIARHFPETRIILIVREPISRVWSYLCMLAREEKFNTGLLNDADRFRSYFANSRTLDGSFPTRILAHWTQFAPAIRFQTFFFDDIETQPATVRRDILLFLDADPGKKSGKLPPDFNRKAGAEKLPLTDPIRAVLLDFLADEIRACAEVLGGPARFWPARYGL